MKEVRYTVIGLIIGLIVGIAVGYGISAKSAPKTTQAAQNPPTVKQLLTLVNAERAKNGVAPLKEDPRLDASAQMKANDEVAYNYFGHERPGSTDFVGADFINATGIQCVYESENLAWNTDKSAITAERAVDWWINSPAHHAAMINAKYSLTGFGIVNDAVVEHFCQQ